MITNYDSIVNKVLTNRLHRIQMKIYFDFRHTTFTLSTM